MSDTVFGGCLCGAVRFEVPSEPFAQLLCHCPDCQKVSGAAAYAAYAVPLDQIKVTGELAQFDVQAASGRTNSRRFCPKCGTRVYAALPEMGMASINGMALDDRDRFQPQGNFFLKTQPGWCAASADLPDMGS